MKLKYITFFTFSLVISLAVVWWLKTSILTVDEVKSNHSK